MDQLEAQLKHNYRINEGFSGGLTGSYSSDNFGNDVANVGLLAEWGPRRRNFHTVMAGRSLVQSDVNANTLQDQLTSLNYTYRHNYRQQTMQSMFGVGVSTANGDFFTQMTAGFWIAGGSSYTSTQFSYSPVMTNTAINRGIDRLRGTLYREDNWLSNDRLTTTLNGTANWYSDEVFSYEALGRIYGKLFSSSLFRTRLIAEAAYQDATINYSSGIPYWTPNELFIKGGGIDFLYQRSAQEPTFLIEAELMVKHNRDGIDLASAGRLNARIACYWSWLQTPNDPQVKFIGTTMSGSTCVTPSRRSCNLAASVQNVKE
ncbi:MAG: hypothetical protein U5K69_20690 [Balneolaceae bacterium]|nr:hypothetical protein [Balneolaceae bacterium]